MYLSEWTSLREDPVSILVCEKIFICYYFFQVITDKNPHVEGLQDVHKCIYLPSSMDKNQYLPNYLNQNILFMVSSSVKCQ